MTFQHNLSFYFIDTDLLKEQVSNIHFGKFDYENFPDTFDEFLLQTEIVEFPPHFHPKNFSAEMLKDKTSFYTFYCFFHTSDFFAQSATHFELNKTIFEYLKDTKCEDLKYYAYQEGKENQKIEQFDFKFLWFQHEERTCTVFSRLKKALGEFSKNKDEAHLIKQLNTIWMLHDEKFRNQKRESLFNSFFSEDTDKKIPNTLDSLI